MPEAPEVNSPLSAARNRLGATGLSLTALGFGAASLGNLYRAIDDDAARATLHEALVAGIGHVDTAPHYGQGLSERRVGGFLADHPDLRAAVTLSTKVGRVLNPIAAPAPGTERHGFIDGDPFEPVFDYSHDGVMRSFEASQNRLGGQRIDILLAHDLGRVTHADDHPRHMRAFLDGGYKAMRALKDQGVVGAIGLGVNEWQVCEEVLGHADLDVVLLAGRYTLLEQAALDSFLPLAQRRGVSILLGGPFNSGILTGGAAYNYAPAPPEIIRRVEALRAVCAAHSVPLAAAALQFPLAHPSVISVIAGMADPAEVAANVKLSRTPIPLSLWSDLKAQGLLHPSAPVPSAHKVL